MKRAARAVVALIALAVVSIAGAAGTPPRVAMLIAGSASDPPNAAFVEGMRELGWIEGKTVIFDRRYANGRIEQLPSLASDAVAARPDVIFAPVTPAALAARKATTTSIES